MQADEEANTSPVFKIGQAGYFTVFDAKPRAIDHNRAHMKLFRGKEAEGSHKDV